MKISNQCTYITVNRNMNILEKVSQEIPVVFEITVNTKKSFVQ